MTYFFCLSTNLLLTFRLLPGGIGITIECVLDHLSDVKMGMAYGVLLFHYIFYISLRSLIYIIQD